MAIELFVAFVLKGSCVESRRRLGKLAFVILVQIILSNPLSCDHS